MKKLLSLCIGAFLATTLMANQPSTIQPLQPTKASVLKELLQQDQLTTAIEASKQQTKAVISSGKASEELPFLPSKNTTISPKAATSTSIDTIELEFDRFYADPLYYESGDWIIVLQNPLYQFSFDFYNHNPQSCAGTYTVEDLDSWFSKAFIPAADGKTSYFKTCDMTITSEKLSENLLRYTLDAFVVTTLGQGGEVNGVFKLHATHTIITADKYVETATYFSTVTLSEDGSSFVIDGKNDSVEVSMAMFTGGGGVVGYYNESFIDIENTTMKYNGQSYTPMNMEAVIYSAEMINGGLAYVAMMEILTTDTTFFNIAMEAPVVPVDTVDITCKNLQLAPEQGAVVIIASNNEYEFYGAYNDVVVTTPAIYTGNNTKMFITNKATGREIESLQATFTVDGNETQGYTVDIEMLGNDHKYYLAHLSWLIPVTKDTVDVVFENSAKALYYVDDLGLEELQLAAYNTQYSAAFDILYINQIMGGEFTMDDLFMEQSFLYKHTAEGDVQIDMAKVDGEIWQEGDTTFLLADVIGFDSVLYAIDMFYAAPVPTDTVTHTFTEDDVFFTNALPEGVFILEATSYDGTISTKIYVKGVENGSVEGTFINDGRFIRNDFEDSETYVSIWDNDEMDYINYAVQKANMTVTMDTSKIITAVATLICENAVCYQFTFITPFERAHLQHDTEYGDIDYTYDETSRLYLQDFINTDQMIYMELTPANLENVTSVYFYATEMDPVIGIPEGVYLISGSGKIGTVVASKGVSVMGYPLESYFCTLDNFDGELYYGDLYCMVDGTITVKNVDGKLKLEVDAVNSYDLSIKLHYEGYLPTSVENITTSDKVGTEKRIIDGQLLIIRNGQIYTATGARVK